MTTKLVDVSRDNEGYLLDPEDWTAELMTETAAEMHTELTDEHLLVIHFIRRHFAETQTVPQARVVLKFLSAAADENRATRKYLYQLFPYGYGQQACKIAGMRKPLKLMLDV